MSVTYFKRFRMEMDLAGRQFPRPELPTGYRLIAWESSLLDAHAEAKYQSFRFEIDSNVFPCLGDLGGCVRLMTEISQKSGFLPQATWLLAYESRQHPLEYCGTIQGICDRSGFGAIQNLGIAPEHRHRGLGTILMHKALDGFRGVGLRRAYLEVTARNESAVKLYRQMGFSRARTVYKAVEMPAYA